MLCSMNKTVYQSKGDIFLFVDESYMKIPVFYAVCSP